MAIKGTVQDILREEVARDLQPYCAHFPSDKQLLLLIVFTFTKLIDCSKNGLHWNRLLKRWFTSPMVTFRLTTVAQSGRLFSFGSMTDCVDNLSGELL